LLDRLLNRPVSNNARDWSHERVGIDPSVDEQPASEGVLLAKGMIDVDGGTWHDVLVVQIRGDSYNAPRLRAHFCGLHNRICPEHMMVDGVRAGKHALGQALADDHDQLAALAIVVVKVATGKYRHSERGKEAGRDQAELSAGIFFAGPANVAVGRELESGSEVARVAPRHGCTERDAVDSRQRANLPHGLFVK